MLSTSTSKTGQQDNYNSKKQTTITILILVDELKYWKCDVCKKGLLTMGDGNIDLLGTQQQRTAAVVCSSSSQKATPKLAHKTTVSLSTRQQSLF
jgi:hypothetical protein